MDKFLTIQVNKMEKKLFLSIFSFFLLMLLPLMAIPGGVSPDTEKGTPILVYHRFGPQVVDSMTVTNYVFEAHLKYLQDNGYRVVPVREFLEQYFNKGVLSTSRMAAITADEG